MVMLDLLHRHRLRGGVFGTGVKFVISPIQVPLQSVFDKPIPADGNDLWPIELGPENRSIKRPVGCRWFSTGMEKMEETEPEWGDVISQ